MQETIHQNTNRQNLLQLLWLRLIAVIGQIATILFAHHVLKISLPLNQMFLVLTILIIISGFGFYRYHFQKNITSKSLFVELLFDVAALTAQLYFSGGISNPFISLFLLQVIIAAILLDAFYAWLIAVLTIGCYIGLGFYYQELHAFHDHEEGDLFNLHLHGMLIGYVMASVLLLIFITKINKNLKARDKKINFLKHQSLQKEQVIRTGLLATSAAHELGTPLSTISVILADWKSMNIDKTLLEDVAIVEKQLNRCKKILSEILSASGKARMEEAKKIPVKKFFDDLVNDWQDSRNPENLIYNFSGNAKEIVADNILSQAFFNIFDNALETSPSFVSIDVTANEDFIEVSVEDQGKGFNKDIIKKIGQPNLTTKNSSGLGLFLAINIFEGIGGNLKISNSKNFGAKVLVKIPVKNL